MAPRRSREHLVQFRCVSHHGSRHFCLQHGVRKNVNRIHLLKCRGVYLIMSVVLSMPTNPPSSLPPCPSPSKHIMRRAKTDRFLTMAFTSPLYRRAPEISLDTNKNQSEEYNSALGPGQPLLSSTESRHPPNYNV